MSGNVEDVKNVVWGRTTQVLSPSGRRFIIRENNGEDDDILSNPVTADNGDNLDYFLSRVVVREIKDEKEVPFTFQDSANLLVKDRIFLLLQNRIHNFGPEMKFTYDFGDDKVKGGKFKFVEDLSVYVFDYTQEFPEFGSEKYNKHTIPPYPENAYGNFDKTLHTGKVVRINLLTVKGQKEYNQLPPEHQTKNAELKSRNIQLLEADGKWTKVENFAMFNSMEMREIRSWVEEIDPYYQPITQITHPGTQVSVNIAIMLLSDFFYPVEI